MYDIPKLKKKQINVYYFFTVYDNYLLYCFQYFEISLNNAWGLIFF